MIAARLFYYQQEVPIQFHLLSKPITFHLLSIIYNLILIFIKLLNSPAYGKGTAPSKCWYDSRFYTFTAFKVCSAPCSGLTVNSIINQPPRSIFVTGGITSAGVRLSAVWRLVSKANELGFILYVIVP